MSGTVASFRAVGSNGRDQFIIIPLGAEPSNGLISASFSGGCFSRMPGGVNTVPDFDHDEACRVVPGFDGAETDSHPGKDL